MDSSKKYENIQAFQEVARGKLRNNLSAMSAVVACGVGGSLGIAHFAAGLHNYIEEMKYLFPQMLPDNLSVINFSYNALPEMMQQDLLTHFIPEVAPQALAVGAAGFLFAASLPVLAAAKNLVVLNASKVLGGLKAFKSIFSIGDALKEKIQLTIDDIENGKGTLLVCAVEGQEGYVQMTEEELRNFGRENPDVKIERIFDLPNEKGFQL